jgi:ABC-type lipoprotein release transport system permease subunit
MRQFLATLRRRPAPLIGTFVALAMAALLVTATTILIGTGITLSAPAQRLADATLVVTGNPDVRVTSGTGGNVERDVLPLPDYRRVPLGLASRLASVDGVAAAVSDVSFQVALELASGTVATGTAAEPFQAHGWASAALTPFRLASGHAPVTASQIVLGSGVAASTGLRIGSAVRLAGQDLPAFTVVGVAAARGANPAGDWTVFLSDAEAAALYGHPGQADLIGIVARPGVSAATLTGRVQALLGGSDLTVLGPAKTGQAEDLAVGADKLDLLQLAKFCGVAVLSIAFFVVAGTIALSVALRWRNLALLRAVGATPGQVRAPAAGPVRSGRRRRDVLPDDRRYVQHQPHRPLRRPRRPALPDRHRAAGPGPRRPGRTARPVPGAGGRRGGRPPGPDIRRRPRRMAAAVSAVALGASFVGINYLIDVTQTHGAVVQDAQRLVADAAVSAPGPGLAPAALQAIASQPGVSTAVGLTPTTVFVPYPGSASNLAEAVTPGPLGAVLNLNVISGTLARFGAGDIALSKTITGLNAVTAKVGDTITTYLADGTLYRARVAAIYSQSLGFADVLIPASVAGGGHLGSATLGEVLVRGAPGVAPVTLSSELARLAARFPGLTVASRSVVNAQAQVYLAQQSYSNNLFLGVIALLAAVALVNTLVMATVERRGVLFLLRRVGATTRQLLSMTIWQTVILDLTGLILGAAAGAASVAVVSKQLAGTWMPYLTWPPMAVIGATVVGLTILAILAPTLWLLTSPIREE